MYDNLVLSAGGSNGICMLGALKVLVAENVFRRPLRTVVGCSVGSLIGCLLLLGKDMELVLEHFKKVDTKRVFRADLQTFIKDMGFISKDALCDVICTVLDTEPDLTFSKLYERTGTKFVVCATCLNTFSDEYFSVDTHPTMLVKDAITMSCAIPILFTSTKFCNKSYIDGGLSNVFPVDYDATGSVLGIGLYGTDFFNKDIRTIPDYIYCVIQTSLRYIKKIPKNVEIFKLDTGEYNGLNFILADNVLQEMYDSGHAQAQSWLKKRL